LAKELKDMPGDAQGWYDLINGTKDINNNNNIKKDNDIDKENNNNKDNKNNIDKDIVIKRYKDNEKEIIYINNQKTTFTFNELIQYIRENEEYEKKRIK
jgi:hypothetical protein